MENTKSYEELLERYNVWLSTAETWLPNLNKLEREIDNLKQENRFLQADIDDLADKIYILEINQVKL